MKRSILALVAAVAIAPGACKKDKKSSAKDSGAQSGTAGGSASEKPEPVALGPKAVAAAIESCWAALAAHDKARLTGCYADEVDYAVVDREPALTGGAEEARAFAEALWESFPELAIDGRLTLVNGRSAVTVALFKGIDEGGVMGAEATGKPWAAAVAAVTELDDAGKIKRQRVWIDQATALSQLGHKPSESAPDAEPAWAKSPTVIAASDEAESKNLATVKQHLAALSADSDPAEVAGRYAGEGTFRYIPEAEEYKGTEALTARIAAYLGPNEKLSVEVLEAWAAGDWVVARTKTSAVIKKGTPGAEALGGKSWNAKYLELFELADGKFTRHIIFANNLRFEIDLGLFDPAQLAAAQDSE